MTSGIALLIILHLREIVSVVEVRLWIFMGHQKIPHPVTHDAHTICYPKFLIKVNDIIQIDLKTGNITDFIKFNAGNLCMVSWVPTWEELLWSPDRERHPGSFDVAHVKDANGNSFAIQLSNNFVIGTDKRTMDLSSSWKGICLSIPEERRDRQPNRAVYKMISRWHDSQSLCT